MCITYKAVHPAKAVSSAFPDSVSLFPEMDNHAAAVCGEWCSRRTPAAIQKQTSGHPFRRPANRAASPQLS